MKVNEMLEKEGPKEIFEKVRGKARDYVYNLREKGDISFSNPKKGRPPSIHVVRRTLPEVWEDTNMALVGIGLDVHTGYDPTETGEEYKGEYKSFPSLEGTVMMHIEEPEGEPKFHKGFLGGWMGFGSYRAEIEGIHDHWMISPDIVVDMLKKGKFDEIKDDKRWNYTYHQRLTSYPFIDINAEPQTINQIDSVVTKLSEESLSKSGQATTWDPRWDHNDGIIKDKNGKKAVWEDYHSPCLQRLWFRLAPFKNGYMLNINGHWRSRDHPKAVPQNIRGLIKGMFEPIRKKLQDSLEIPVYLGRYVDINDSLHVYGHYLDPRQQGGDAGRYLQMIIDIAEGKPIKDRIVEPGSNMHDIYMEEIEKEYKQTIDMTNKEKG